MKIEKGEKKIKVKMIGLLRVHPVYDKRNAFSFEETILVAF